MARVKLFIEGTQATLLTSSLEKQGERGIDQIKVTLPITATVDINDKMLYLQDIVNINGLSALYNFQNSAKDESGNNNHGTVSNTTVGEDSWDGKALVFNGTNAKVTITDNNTLDLSGVFDIYTWVKWTATTSPMYVLSKRSSSSNGWALAVNKTTAGDVAFYIGSNSITSSTAGYNDGEYHLVRVKRDTNNLVTLYVDDVSKGTMTNNTNLTDTNNLLIGNDASVYFNGTISRFRIYKGYTLGGSDATTLFSARNARSTMKFGGYVTKVDVDLTHKSIMAQSFGKVMGETEIRGTVYDDRTPEYIVNDLITNNTTLTYRDEGELSGVTLSKYIADGKLVDIIREFAVLTNKTFFTTGLEEFFFLPKSYNDTSLNFTHGVNAVVSRNGFDDTEIVNDLTVLGENKRYSTTDTFNGNGSTVEFTISENAVSTKVTVGGTEKTPEVDYEIDTLGRTLTFTTAPSSGSNNIVVEYEYEAPLFFRGTRQSSITTYGVHAKKLNMPWISTRGDGVRFIQLYLNRYKDVIEKVRVELGNLLGTMEESDIIQIINSVTSISGDYAVKSITWKYPDMTTSIEAGEYFFGYYEMDKQIVQKIHDLEGALTSVKTLRDYESPEEVFVLNDIVVQIVSEDFTESLSITESDNIYDMQAATYGVGAYGSKRAGVNTGSVYTSG